jgi:hypothetical protein
MTESLIDLGLAVACETCESEIELDASSDEVGLCRQCGLSFLLDGPAADAGGRDGLARLA